VFEPAVAKTIVVDRKKTEGISSAMFGVGAAANKNDNLA